MNLVFDELNTYGVKINETVSYQHPDFSSINEEKLKSQGEARRIVRQIQEERKKLGTAMDEKVHVELPDYPKDFAEYIKKHALAASLKKGQVFKVERA
jgi:hypothetical protein